MATLIDFFKPVRTGESTLPLHLAEEARTCSDDRKTNCQTATDTKGSSTSATNMMAQARTLRVLSVPVTALVLGLGIIFASAYIRQYYPGYDRPGLGYIYKTAES